MATRKLSELILPNYHNLLEDGLGPDLRHSRKMFLRGGRFSGNTIIYSEPDLTGEEYYYKPNTSVKILENVNNEVDKVYVIYTGRIGYVSVEAYV